MLRVTIPIADRTDDDAVLDDAINRCQWLLESLRHQKVARASCPCASSGRVGLAPPASSLPLPLGEDRGEGSDFSKEFALRLDQDASEKLPHYADME